MMTFSSKKQGQIDALRKLMTPLYRDDVYYAMELLKFTNGGLRLHHLCVVKEADYYRVKFGTVTDVGSITSPKFSEEGRKFAYDFEAKSKLEELAFPYEDDGYIVTKEITFDISSKRYVPDLSLSFDNGVEFYSKYRDIQSEVISQPVRDGILVVFGKRHNEFIISEWSLQNKPNTPVKRFDELSEAFQRLKTGPDFKSLCGIGVYDGNRLSILDCWEGGLKNLSEMSASERLTYLKKLTETSSKIEVISNDITPDSWLAPCSAGQVKATFVRPDNKGFDSTLKAIVLTSEPVKTVFIDKFNQGKAIGKSKGIPFSVDIPCTAHELLMEDFIYIGNQTKGLLLPQ